METRQVIGVFDNPSRLAVCFERKANLFEIESRDWKNKCASYFYQIGKVVFAFGVNDNDSL